MEPPEPERFGKNVSILLQAVTDAVNMLNNKGYNTINPTLLQLVIPMIKNIDNELLMQKFIDRTHEICWDMILKRNEKFFIDNAESIFKDLPVDKISLFKDIYLTKDSAGNYVIPNSLKEQVWKLFDNLVKISIKYIHKNRGPMTYIDNVGNKIYTYSAEFYPEVDLELHASKWKVMLSYE